MKAEIIPTILVKTFDEFEAQIRAVDPYVKTIQIDIADGKFVPNTTFGDPDALKKVRPKSKIEVHLMTVEPVEQVDQWKKAGADRIIFHYETCRDLSELTRTIRTIKKAGLAVGLAVNPKTSIESLHYIIDNIDEVLFLGVEPGFGGQKFQKSVLKKIKKLRSWDKKIDIGVDGGIKPKEAKLAYQAGANLINSGSYIHRSKNVKEAIGRLKQAVGK